MDEIMKTKWDVVFAHELGHYVAQILYQDGKTNLGAMNIGFCIREADKEIKGWVTPIKPKGLTETKTIPLNRIASFISKIAHGCIFQAALFPGEKLLGQTPFTSCFNSFSSDSKGKHDHTAFTDHLYATLGEAAGRHHNRIDMALDKFTKECTQSGALESFAKIKVEKYIPTAYSEVKGTFEISGIKLSELKSDCKHAIENYRDRFFELHDELDLIVKTEL